MKRSAFNSIRINTVLGVVDLGDNSAMQMGRQIDIHVKGDMASLPEQALDSAIIHAIGIRKEEYVGSIVLKKNPTQFIQLSANKILFSQMRLLG